MKYRKYFSTGLIMSCILALTVYSCASLEPETAHETRSIPFRTISHGTQGGVESSGITVIRTASEWDDLMQKLPDRMQGKADPEFPEEMVIGVFLGQKPTGGYSVTIEYVRDSGDHIEVTYRISEPEPGSMNIQVLTFPYHLVVIPHQDTQIVFRHVE